MWFFRRAAKSLLIGRLFFGVPSMFDSLRRVRVPLTTGWR